MGRGKRCPDCRGLGFRIIRDTGESCARCEGVGVVDGAQSVPPATAAALAVRSGGICEICHRHPATDKHHRQYRSRGGLHTIENLLHICGPGNVFGCHGDAHGPNPLEGVSISRWERRTPDQIPFVDANGDPWTLTTDGKRERISFASAVENFDPWRKP